MSMSHTKPSHITGAIATQNGFRDQHRSDDRQPIFYATAVSLYCAKVRIILRHKQIDWHEKQPDGGYGSLAWRRKVPAGNLPALKHKDVVLTDSEVIAEYLEEVWPETAMQAKAPVLRALVRQRGRFHDTRLEPALRVFFGWLGKRSDHPDAAAFDQLQQRLDQCGQLLNLEQHQLSASCLWLGDCGFAASFPWIDIVEQKAGHSFNWPDQVLGLRHHLESFQAVKDEYMAYIPAINRWMET